MATIFSHPAVALGLYPWFKNPDISKSTLCLGAFLTILPDFDVVGFKFGIAYGHMFGHRGFSHSIFCAVLVGAVLANLMTRGRPEKYLSSWIYLTLCMASHGIIDAFTNGGKGIALLSPFSNIRLFAPVQPIQVSALNITRFFESQGKEVLLSELIWLWGPCIILYSMGWVTRYLSQRELNITQ